MSTSLKDDVRKAVEYSPSGNWIPLIGREGQTNISDSSYTFSTRTFHDFREKVCGKKYDVGYKIDKCHPVKWIRGTLMNYNSGNLDLETDNGYVIHIPYEGLKWLLPAKKDI